MESAARNLIKITEQCNIKPMMPAKPQRLPLTFFDILLLPFPPVQRVFFFEYPHTESQFLARDLPNLKHSLSLALTHFYPLAGTLSASQDPEIRCSGNDSICFTVAVSHANFLHLSANHARDIEDFHSLVPQPLALSGDDETAILAVQVTVFPNAGISVGTSVHHGAADGSTYANFIKTWASLCRSGAADTAANYLPSLDRSALLTADAKGLKSIFLKDLEAFDVDSSVETLDLRAGHHTKDKLVISTFVFSRETLDRLRSRSSVRCSSFSLACGYMWACLIKARGDAYDPSKDVEYFAFLANCRARHDPPLPASYFGNCVGICCAEARRDELVGEDGAVIAAKAIWTVIKRLEEGVFDGVENWIKDTAYYSSMKALSVAGSPKLGIYEVDFGWGRPRKMEVISIERTGALSLAETRAEIGGIEVGLVLPINEMDKMVSIFADGLNDAP